MYYDDPDSVFTYTGQKYLYQILSVNLVSQWPGFSKTKLFFVTVSLL